MKIVGLSYPDVFLGAWVNPAFPNGEDLARTSVALYEDFNGEIVAEYAKFGAALITYGCFAISVTQRLGLRMNASGSKTTPYLSDALDALRHRREAARVNVISNPHSRGPEPEPPVE